jgi:hypothetical protein
MSHFLIPSDSPEAQAFYERHLPAAEAWIAELEASHDPFVASAAHAVFCLLSSFAFADDPTFDWLAFDPHDFLFRDLAEGGTVGMDGPVPVFFDHLVEAIRRFTSAGVIDRPLGAQLVAEMTDAREDFERFYDPSTDDDELLAIERRRSTRPPMMSV